ncbi:hypothetical protein BOH78_4509 [Pichia kudriavzevii]|nr:hypothetical protein BOH78_5085 [Pichia kudriavzevii]ONH71446.1 hypothetical protein BOH78_4509 [Pichia kudriavzevii]
MTMLSLRKDSPFAKIPAQINTISTAFTRMCHTPN